MVILGGQTSFLLKGVNLIEDRSLTGENIINADPNLASLGDDGSGNLTHTLQPGSPAIDAGDNSNISPDVLDLDRDGDKEEPIPIDQLSNQRIFNDTVDLGAVEFGSTFVDIPSATGNHGSLNQTTDLFDFHNTTFDTGT